MVADSPEREAAPEPGVVRKTIDGALSLVTSSYDSVKNSNQALKSGLEKVEATASPYTAPALEKLDSISAPFVDRLDDRIDTVVIPAVHTVNEKVVSTVNTVKEGAKGVNDKLVTTKAALSQAAASRLESSLTTIRQLSANELKAYLHVDLLKYAQEVYENALTTAQPYRVLLTENAAKLVATAQALRADISRGAPELKVKLQAAREAAKILSIQSIAFLVGSTKKGALALSVLPEQLKDEAASIKEQGFVETLRAAPSESVKFILAAPTFFAKSVDNLKQQEEALDLIAAIRQLVAAVTDVFNLEPEYEHVLLEDEEQVEARTPASAEASEEDDA